MNNSTAAESLALVFKFAQRWKVEQKRTRLLRNALIGAAAYGVLATVLACSEMIR